MNSSGLSLLAFRTKEPPMSSTVHGASALANKIVCSAQLVVGHDLPVTPVAMIPVAMTIVMMVPIIGVVMMVIVVRLYDVPSVLCYGIRKWCNGRGSGNTRISN
jgi:hypothetical protein